MIVLLCFTLYLRAISEYKPQGGLYLEGQFNEGFLRHEFGELILVEGLINGGAYFQNYFTVFEISLTESPIFKKLQTLA